MLFLGKSDFFFFNLQYFKWPRGCSWDLNPQEAVSKDLEKYLGSSSSQGLCLRD